MNEAYRDMLDRIREAAEMRAASLFNERDASSLADILDRYERHGLSLLLSEIEREVVAIAYRGTLEFPDFKGPVM